MHGIVLAMESERSAGKIFHIGSPQEITIRTLIETVGQLVGYTGEYLDAPTYPGSVSRRCPDISKAREMLGYSPKTDWKDGLATTVSWYLDYFTKNKTAKQDGFKPQEALTQASRVDT